MANLRGAAAKASRKMKQMVKQAAAATLKPAKISRRSHRLTIRKERTLAGHNGGAFNASAVKLNQTSKVI